MATKWTDISENSNQFLVIDALGSAIDSVKAFRNTADGIEVIAVAVTPEGTELLCSRDGGITFDAIRARMDIPGGAVFDLNDEE